MCHELVRRIMAGPTGCRWVEANCSAGCVSASVLSSLLLPGGFQISTAVKSSGWPAAATQNLTVCDRAAAPLLTACAT